MVQDGSIQGLDQQAVSTLAGLLTDTALPSDAEGLAGLLTALEELKATAAAVQARAGAALAEALIDQQRATGVPARQVGHGVAAAVAFARRESPHAGDRWLGFARALVTEMPGTLGLLEQGVLSEYRAQLIVAETACLSAEDRRTVDAELSTHPDLATWGNRRLSAQARAIAYRLDPHASVSRHAKAVTDRSVTLRPAPDDMTWLTALLPVQQGVACLKALHEAADTLHASGEEPRSRGQVMADTLVERLTGQTTADNVGVGVLLVMSEASLLRGDPAAAAIPGYGPVSAALARTLIARAAQDQDAAGWLRRLYRAPGNGELVGLDSRSRRFPAGLATLIEARDQTCRTPWCDAPIRHTDHAIPYHNGGDTSYRNGQGLCEACNHAKQAPGWEALPRPGPFAPIQVTTPAGQSRTTRAPTPPGLPAGEQDPARPALPRHLGGGVPPLRIDISWPAA